MRTWTLALLSLFVLAACESAVGGGDTVADVATSVDGFHFGDGAVAGDLAVADLCQPQCGPLEEGGPERDCGDDGCGGLCGECTAGTLCQAGFCVACTPNCEFRNCGDDGCGGTCGQCGLYQVCNAHTGRCEMDCIPNCAGKVCGPDGCGNSCGDCPGGELCNRAKGSCAATCEPWCPPHRECGGDGCGGACASQRGCVFPKSCDEATGRCVDECVRQCEGKECGDDGCGGRCAYCPQGEGCEAGQCRTLPLSCAQTFQCALACPVTEEDCPVGCQSQAAAGSSSLYNGLASCRQTNCAGVPLADLKGCLAESCASQLTACGLDFICGDPGTSQCSTVSSCMSGCGDAACVNACLCRADESSYAAALDYANCLIQACPSMDSACVSAAGGMMMGACMMQWMNCFGQ